MENTTKVFVYGTLKRGYWNNKRYLNNSIFLGPAISEDDSYGMRCNGYYPIVYEKHGAHSHVKGELYTIRHFTLENLDDLEGNGHFYNRHKRNFVLNSGEVVSAWIYLCNFKGSFHKNDNVKNYIDASRRPILEWKR